MLKRTFIVIFTYSITWDCLWLLFTGYCIAFSCIVIAVVLKVSVSTPCSPSIITTVCLSWSNSLSCAVKDKLNSVYTVNFLSTVTTTSRTFSAMLTTHAARRYRKIVTMCFIITSQKQNNNIVTYDNAPSPTIKHFITKTPYLSQ